MSHYMPYPAYKGSGVALLGNVPAHWTVTPLRWIASYQNSNVDKKSYEAQSVVRLCNYTDVYYNEFIRDSMEFMSATASEDEIDSMSLQLGEIVITKDSEDPSDIGIPSLVAEELKGVVCGYHLTVIRPPIVYSGFLHRAIQATPSKAHFRVEAPGITRFGLGQNAIGSLKIALPPPEEGKKIAIHLDRETTRMDALVAKKTRFIELLREKRQALITQAVTKGLDPNVKIKDSGVEWLGEVPEHWEVKQLMHLVHPDTVITYGIVQAGPDYEGGIPYIKTSDMSGKKLPIIGYSLTSPEIDQAYTRSKVFPGDLVIAIRATIGKCLPVPDGLPEANLTQGTAKISPADWVDKNYLLAMIQSDAVQGYLSYMAKGSTFKEITLEALRRTPVLLPPYLEQCVISEYLVDRTTRFDKLIQKTKHSIDLLKERRAALITAAVTGQIDLRAAA